MSRFLIEDGEGSGRKAHVRSDNRLQTAAVSIPVQAKESRENGTAYQVSTTGTIAASDQPILYLENTSATKVLVVTYIRVMSASAASTNEDAYFTIKTGCTYTSGGASLTPTNMNQTSANVAEATAYGYGSSLTVSGGTEIDRNYSANSMQAYAKEGTIVLGRGDSICVHHKGSTVAGTAYARISFYYVDLSLV